MRLFEIAYFIAKEERPFVNMSKLVALEKLHGVDLGTAYGNNQACKIFTRYNALLLREPLQQHLKPVMSQCSTTTYPYHSLFTDGTTYKSTTEREVVNENDGVSA